MAGPLAPPDPNLPLSVEGLTIQYGVKRAVDGLQLAVRSGEIYGLLGSNGAGKSSTIRSIVGLVTPSIGVVRVFGHDVTREPIATKARWAQGKVEAAILTEHLTDEISKHYDLDILCGYVLTNFQREREKEVCRRISAEHSSVRSH